MFCEYEIITEPEEYTPKLGKTETERMAEYEKFMTENKPCRNYIFVTAFKGIYLPCYLLQMHHTLIHCCLALNSDANDISTDLARMATGENTEDETFQVFKERISHEPEQVYCIQCQLRY